MPKYMLLLHDNLAAFANVSPEQMQKVVDAAIRPCRGMPASRSA